MKKGLYVVPSHKYGLGTFINNVQGSVTDGKYTGGLFSGMSEGLGNAMGAIGSAVGGVAGGLIGGGRTSAAGDIIGGLGKVASAIPGPWGAIAGVGLGAISGLTNAAFGVKLNQENINAVNNNITAMNSFQSNAGSFDALTQNFMNQPTSMRFNQNFIGKNGWFNKGATRKYNELVAQQDAAQQFVDNSLINNMNNITTTQNQNLLANYAALGGPLSSHGTDWNTGLNYVGNGGSHEENPYDGVPMGIAPDGQPNLVEEGEVIWNNDYVFSKRLKVPKAVRHKYKLGGLKPLSFADAVMQVNKEAEERPNDPITLRGRDAILGALAEVQDVQRAKKEAKEQSEDVAMVQDAQPMIAADGGHLFWPGGSFPRVDLNPFYSSLYREDEDKYDGRFIPWTARKSAKDWLNTFDSIYGVNSPYNYKELPGTKNSSTLPIARKQALERALVPSITTYLDSNIDRKKIEDSALNIGVKGLSPRNKDATSKTNNFSSWMQNLRYAPIVGSLFNVVNDSIHQNDVDYTVADALGKISKDIRDVSATPIDTRVKYIPNDVMRGINELNALSGTTNRGVLNTSAGNRGTATAGLLAADNNFMNNVGNTLFSAENSNYDRYLKARTLGMEGDKYNSELMLKAAMANQGADEVRARYKALSAEARQKALNAYDDRISLDWTNFFNNLGKLGEDAANRGDMRFLAQFFKGYNAATASKGGKLNRRRK